MPYVLLAIAVLLGAYGLYRFFLSANVQQIKSLFLVLIALVMAVSLFFLAITGRLATALGLMAAATPLALGYMRTVSQRRKREQTHKAASSGGDSMTRDKAFEILGLKENASRAQIIEAHKRLMKKIHPDQEGSEWLAKQINAAKDFLLK